MLSTIEKNQLQFLGERKPNIQVFLINKIRSLMTSLFQRIGGHEQLQKIVAQFYQFALTDENINSFYFQNASDIPKLHLTMVQFLTFLFGGPNHYKGPDMHTLHKGMPINDQQYNTNWAHFQSALLVYKIDKELVAEVKLRFYTTKSDIITDT